MVARKIQRIPRDDIELERELEEFLQLRRELELYRRDARLVRSDLESASERARPPATTPHRVRGPIHRRGRANPHA